MSEKLPTADRTCAPWAWAGEVIYEWRWPVTSGYRIVFGDGSEIWCPEWGKMATTILTMKHEGYYEDVTITSWGTADD